MNCDQVFEILTRGPFPTNTSVDAGVERHLEACHECREMAEALRPAVALFHESLSTAEAEDLPGYRGEVAPVERMVATVLAEPAPPKSPPQPVVPHAVKSPRSHLWLIVASLALSTFAIGLWSASIVSKPGSHEQLRGGAEQVPQLLRLASLNLPEACRTAAKDRPSSKADSKAVVARLNCCRNCHVVPTDARPPLDALAVVANSCSACH